MSVQSPPAKSRKHTQVFRVLIGFHTGIGPNGENKMFRARRPDDTADYRGDLITVEDDLDGLSIEELVNRMNESFDPGTIGAQYSEAIGDRKKMIAALRSKTDLVDLYNQGLSRKFERVEAPSFTEKQLDQMTLPQLYAVAEEEGVELKGASKKEEVTKAIQAKRDTAATAE